MERMAKAPRESPSLSPDCSHSQGRLSLQAQGPAGASALLLTTCERESESFCRLFTRPRNRYPFNRS